MLRLKIIPFCRRIASIGMNPASSFSKRNWNRFQGGNSQFRPFSNKKNDMFDKTEQYDRATHPRQLAKDARAAEIVVEKGKTESKVTADSVTDLKYLMHHPIWSKKELFGVEITHRKPKGVRDWVAYSFVQSLRVAFDIFSGYKFGPLTAKNVITRVVLLETIAAVPGMVGAMVRHLHSLRLMKRDYGWIHTLLEEAENERLHLLSAIKLMKPNLAIRMLVLIAQGVFVTAWFITYLLSPKLCHRVVGYLEEEAYTTILEKIDDGTLKEFNEKEAPGIAKSYWRMKDDATLRDMFLNIRADEMHHRDVNHDLADKEPGDKNPWVLDRHK